MKQFRFLSILCALVQVAFSQTVYSQIGIKMGVTSIKHVGVELQAGLQYGFWSDKQLCLAAEALYSRYKEENPAFSFHRTTEFLAIPIVLKFHLTKPCLFLLGPQMEITIHHKTDEIFSFSPALAVGMEYRCYKGVVLTGRYILSDAENLQIACAFSLKSLKGEE